MSLDPNNTSTQANAREEDYAIFISNLKHDYEKEFMLALTKKMKDHSLTHYQLAHIVGKSRSAITMWLTGKAGLMIKDALLIADFFNIKCLNRFQDSKDDVQQ